MRSFHSQIKLRFRNCKCGDSAAALFCCVWMAQTNEVIELTSIYAQSMMIQQKVLCCPKSSLKFENHDKLTRHISFRIIFFFFFPAFRESVKKLFFRVGPPNLRFRGRPLPNEKLSHTSMDIRASDAMPRAAKSRRKTKKRLQL
jgi:hypothetical protein